MYESLQAPRRDVAHAIRSRVFTDLATIPEFAAGLAVSTSAVRSWIYRGLPSVKVGRRPFVHIAEGIAWVKRQGTKGKRS